MKKDWLYYRKSDRKVLFWLLIVLTLIASVLVIFFTPGKDERPKIEQPEHWWEK